MCLCPGDWEIWLLSSGKRPQAWLSLVLTDCVVLGGSWQCLSMALQLPAGTEQRVGGGRRGRPSPQMQLSLTAVAPLLRNFKKHVTLLGGCQECLWRPLGWDYVETWQSCLVPLSRSSPLQLQCLRQA